MIRQLLALAVFAASLWSSWLLAQRITRRSLQILAPVAVGFLVAYESILFNVLSVVRAVTVIPVTFFHAVPAALVLIAAERRRRGALRDSVRLLASPPKPLYTVLPLVVILGFLAVYFPPSNWDSMTYHMARVAHWMQNGSVAYFPTSNDRQNYLGPGAEYLILALQLMAGTDRWANLVQLFGWMALAVSLPGICRLAGVRRGLSAWAAACALAAPMVLLQASNTQNDLIAGVLGMALVVATLPFLKKRGPRWIDAFVLAVVAAASALVKPTALVVSAPVWIWAGISWVGRLKRRPFSFRRGAVVAAGAVVLAAVILGPDAVRKAAAPRPRWVSEVLYPADLTGAGRRLFNIAAGVAHHLFPQAWTERSLDEVARLTGIHASAGNGPLPIFGSRVFTWHEDFAGNPLQAWTAILLSVLLLVNAPRFIRSGKGRAIAFALIPIGSWCLFQLVFRDNPWLSRLQTPLFLIAPLLWAGLGRSRLVATLLTIATVVAVAYGYVASTNQVRKSLLAWPILTMDRRSSYYGNNPDVKASHDRALETLQKTGCRRLALQTDFDSYEYPLTWRAMRSGVAFRHEASVTSWPCVVFRDLSGPPLPASSGPWQDAGLGVFFRTPT